MAEFAINITDTYAVCTQLENTMQKIARLENRLDNAASGVGGGTSARGRIRERVVTCANKVKDGRRDIRTLNENLNEIVGIYNSAEKKVLTEMQSSEMPQKQQVAEWFGGTMSMSELEEKYREYCEKAGLMSGVMPTPIAMYEMLVSLFGDAVGSGLFDEKIIEKWDEIMQKNYTEKNNFFASNFIQTVTGILDDGMEPFGNMEDILSWLNQDDVEIPGVHEVLDGIEIVDWGIDTIRGVEDYIAGWTNDDTDTMAEGSKSLIQSFMKMFGKTKFSGEEKVFAPDILNPVKLLSQYATNMVTGFIDGVTADNPTVEGMVYETFVDSGLNVALDAVQEAANAGIAIIYEPIAWVTDKFGFDLDAIYEKNSDKEGIFAVFDNVSQFVDMVKENSSWENWTSGLKSMGDGIKSGIKKLFS